MLLIFLFIIIIFIILTIFILILNKFPLLTSGFLIKPSIKLYRFHCPNFLGQPKIYKLTSFILINNNILKLYIPMNNFLIMNIHQRLNNIQDKLIVFNAYRFLYELAGVGACLGFDVCVFIGVFIEISGKIFIPLWNILLEGCFSQLGENVNMDLFILAHFWCEDALFWELDNLLGWRNLFLLLVGVDLEPDAIRVLGLLDIDIHLKTLILLYWRILVRWLLCYFPINPASMISQNIGMTEGREYFGFPHHLLDIIKNIWFIWARFDLHYFECILFSI